jgi:hypothetical protein
VSRNGRVTHVALIAVGVLALVAAQLGADPSSAAPDPGTAPVQAGTASATGAVLGVVPFVSGLSLSTAAGQTSAAYEEHETQATAATVNLGGLAVLAENSPVCGQSLSAKDLPEPLTVDSDSGPTSQSEGSTSAGGESVQLSSSPEGATATTDNVNQALPGVIDVQGTSTSAVQYLAGSEQEADATVTDNVTLAGGLISLSDLKWTASQHSGTKAVSTATFTFGPVTINAGGVPVTLPAGLSPASVAQAVNAVLTPLGLTMDLPVESFDATTQAVSISPLQLQFSGSPTENKLLSPAAGSVAAIEALVAGESETGSDCSNIKELIGQLSNPADTVINLGIGTVGGTGGVDLDLGGASAGSEPPPAYTSPFGSGSGSGGTTAGGGVPATGAVSPAGSGPDGPSDAASAIGTAPSSGATALGGLPTPTAAAPTATAVTPAFAVRCVTTSPANVPRCWRGLGTYAGAGVVILGGGLFAGDIRRGQKTRRRHRPTQLGAP